MTDNPITSSVKPNQKAASNSSGWSLYKSTSASTERLLSTSKLTSGLPYQRPVEKPFVDHLVQTWNERLFHPLIVSLRDGRFYVVDGQHRIAAIRQLNGSRDTMVRCQVYTDLTYEAEAELYYQLDKARHNLTLAQSTKALSQAGSDPKIIEIQRLLKQVGFVWSFGKRTGKSGEISCVRAIIRAYDLLGGAAFTRMLRLLRETWQGIPSSLNSMMLSGMALFLKTYETEIKDSAFIKRLSQVDPEEIIRRGKLDFSTDRRDLRYARVIREKYNARRGGQKLPNRFAD